MSPRQLGSRIKVARENAGLTQAELAKKSRVSQGYIAQLEGGQKKSPSLGSLKRLAKALRLRLTDLLE